MKWLLYIPARMAVDAWGLWVMWAWFVVPLGAPHLGYWQAMGLDLVLGIALLAAVHVGTESDEDRWSTAIAKLFAVPTVVLVGWIVLLIQHAA